MEQMQYLRGRNLLRGTMAEKTANNSYQMAEFGLAEAPTDNETVTFSMDVTAGSDRTQFTLFNSGGSVALGNVMVRNISGGRLKLTFPWKSVNSSGTRADNTTLRIYQYPSSGSSASTISRCKLERGSMATDWCRADEDYDTAPVAYFDYVDSTPQSRLLQKGEAPTGAQVFFDTNYKRFYAVKDSKYYGRWPGCALLGTPYGTGYSSGSMYSNASGITPIPGRLYICRGTMSPYVQFAAGEALEELYARQE